MEFFMLVVASILLSVVLLLGCTGCLPRWAHVCFCVMKGMLSKRETFRTWSSTVSNAKKFVETPSSEAELKQIILCARKVGDRIRLVGRAHSQGPLVCGSNELRVRLVSLEKFERMERFAITPDGVATVAGSLPLYELNRIAMPFGFRLPTQTGIGDISVAGAVSTSTHGGGIGKSLLLCYVVRLQVMQEDGNTCWTQKGDDLFHAVLGSFGSCGIILRVAIQLDSCEAFTARVKEFQVDSIHQVVEAFKKQSSPLANARMFAFLPGDGHFRGMVMEHFTSSKSVSAHTKGLLPPIECDSYHGTPSLTVFELQSSCFVQAMDFASMHLGAWALELLREQSMRWFTRSSTHSTRTGGFWVGNVSSTIFSAYFVPVKDWMEVENVLRALTRIEESAELKLTIPFEIRFVTSCEMIGLNPVPLKGDTSNCSPGFEQMYLAVDFPLLSYAIGNLDVKSEKPHLSSMRLRLMQRFEAAMMEFPGARPHLAKLFGVQNEGDSWWAFDTNSLLKSFGGIDVARFAANQRRFNQSGVFGSAFVDSLVNLQAPKANSVKQLTAYT